jgi:hypothetical protein
MHGSARRQRANPIDPSFVMMPKGAAVRLWSFHESDRQREEHERDRPNGSRFRHVRHVSFGESCMSNNQMNAEQKAAATLGQLGAEVVWLGASGVDSVYFTREGITDADLKPLKGLANLTKLKLNRSLITDAGLKHLQSLTSLVQLHLAGTKITDAGLEYLKRFNNLGFLDLSNTQVTNAGLEYLNSFTNCRTIRLSGTKVTSTGRTKLQGALTGCKITH